MGILDSLENNPAFRSALGQIGAAVLPVVMSEVMGTGSQGGLSAIVAKLEQAGFGDQVKSWIGNGQNIPITADQLKQVLGNDTVRQIAAKYLYPLNPQDIIWWQPQTIYYVGSLRPFLRRCPNIQ